MPTGWFARVRSQGAELWSKLTTPTKLLLAGLGLAGAIALILTAQYNKPHYVALPGQPFDPKDLNEVVARLDDLGVPYQPSADGTVILVPQENLLNARLALAQAGVPGGPTGYELFDKPNLATTDFERKVNLLRAQEGELSRTIAAMAPVKRAVVKLAIPEQTVFVREQKPVKAAVMIEPRVGRELSSAEVEGVIRFLAWSVPELDPENVMVVDHTGRVLMAGLTPNQVAGDAAATGVQLDRQIAYQKELEQKLTGLLERSLGVGNVSVMASVKLKFESTRQEETKYENAGPNGQSLVRSEQTQSTFFEGQGAPPEQPAGTDANTATPPIYQGSAQAGGTSTYENKNGTKNYELNEIKTFIERPPGEVESVSVGVFVNDKVIPASNAQQLAQIQQVVASAVGTPLEMVTVATMPFNDDLVRALTAEPAAPGREAQWQMIAAGALAAAAVVFLLLFWSRRRRMAPETMLAGAGGPMVHVAASLAAAGGGAGDEPGSPASTSEDEVGLLGEDFLAQVGGDPARMKLRQEVEKLAKQSPDLVASLLKSWMTEEKK